MNHWVLAAARRHARMRWASTSVVVMLLLVGCKATVDIPDVVRTPEIAAEILVRTFVDARVVELETAQGDRVQIDLNEMKRIDTSTDADEGDLLLYGTEPDGPWFWAGRLRDDPVTGRQCAYMEGRAVKRGDSLVFEIGLRLPKAPDFDPVEQSDGEYTAPDRYFCVDEHGQVTRYGA